MRYISQFIKSYFDLSYSDTFKVELPIELKQPLDKLTIDTYAIDHSAVVMRALDYYAKHVKENGVALVPTSYEFFLQDLY